MYEMHTLFVMSNECDRESLNKITIYDVCTVVSTDYWLVWSDDYYVFLSPRNLLRKNNSTKMKKTMYENNFFFFFFLLRGTTKSMGRREETRDCICGVLLQIDCVTGM